MRERAAEFLARPSALRCGEVERTGAGTAPCGRALRAPDAVAHVSVVLLNLLVAAGQVQRDLFHVVDVAVADVPHAQAGRFHFSFEANEILGRGGFALRGNIDVMRPTC